MAPKKKGAQVPAPASSASASSSSGSQDATKELKQELRLWNKFGLAMLLIKRQSEVYHAAEEGAEAGKVFIYPIVAAFDSEMGAADPSEEEMDKKMRLVQLLAIVDQAPEPTPHDVFRMLDESFALCDPLFRECTEEEVEDVAALLERMHDIGEYLQLEKRLCKRVKQLLAAEASPVEGVDGLKNDKELGPLLKGTLDKLAATKVPFALSGSFKLSDCLWAEYAVKGALGCDPAKMDWPYNESAIGLFRSQLYFLFGQGVARRALSPSLLKAVKESVEYCTLSLSIHLVEALVVLGEGQAALKMVEEGGIEMPESLIERGDALEVE